MRSGSIPSMFCQAGGISIRSARGNSTPPVVRSSSMLSRLEESEPSVFTKGASTCRSGSNGESSLALRALDQLPGEEGATTGASPALLDASTLAESDSCFGRGDVPSIVAAGGELPLTRDQRQQIAEYKAQLEYL